MHFVTVAVLSLLLVPPNFRKLSVPWSAYLPLVGLFWVISLLNHWALEYRIDMILHILVKSGGMVMNMLLGKFIFGKR